mmetsp:Transcript_41616/g.77526  ORF Transcript_41616/g.77526 Transcript_41616/m.77526 type:complete len:201 (+) Transcript_41616:3023-3625(+)
MAMTTPQRCCLAYGPALRGALENEGANVCTGSGIASPALQEESAQHQWRYVEQQVGMLVPADVMLVPLSLHGYCSLSLAVEDILSGAKALQSLHGCRLASPESDVERSAVVRVPLHVGIRAGGEQQLQCISMPQACQTMRQAISVLRGISPRCYWIHAMLLQSFAQLLTQGLPRKRKHSLNDAVCYSAHGSNIQHNDCMH